MNSRWHSGRYNTPTGRKDGRFSINSIIFTYLQSTTDSSINQAQDEEVEETSTKIRRLDGLESRLQCPVSVSCTVPIT